MSSLFKSIALYYFLLILRDIKKRVEFNLFLIYSPSNLIRIYFLISYSLII